jgi:1-phosphatidylinositol-4-phosphate 5-kinase
LEANPRSLLTKLYGLHKIKVNDDKIYFIVMGNIFKTDLLIHKKYDIKGSLYKRTTD